MDFWNEYRSIGVVLAQIGLLIASIRYGELPERIMAGSLIAMALLSTIYFDLISASPRLQEIDPGLFLIDVFVVTVMVAVALRANRIYPLWMAGFQIIAVMAHFARGLSDAISPIAYVIMFVGPSYFQIIILGFGIWLHARRVRRHGSYRSWRSCSNLSPDRVR